MIDRGLSRNVDEPGGHCRLAALSHRVRNETMDDESVLSEGFGAVRPTVNRSPASPTSSDRRLHSHRPTEQLRGPLEPAPYQPESDASERSERSLSGENFLYSVKASARRREGPASSLHPPGLARCTRPPAGGRR